MKASTLFPFLSPECRQIASPSRQYNSEEKAFIELKTKKHLELGIIEPSNSPWQSQIVVTSNERHKKHMVIDYSQTINCFTLLDAYLLLNFNELVNSVSKYLLFSTFDLKSAYQQISCLKSDKYYTTFESNGLLFQFKRIPFGLTNAVAQFQRIMDKFIQENKSKNTFVYLDNLLVCGTSKNKHGFNLEKCL
jgi:hypothetical protein